MFFNIFNVTFSYKKNNLSIRNIKGLKGFPFSSNNKSPHLISLLTFIKKITLYDEIHPCNNFWLTENVILL